MRMTLTTMVKVPFQANRNGRRRAAELGAVERVKRGEYVLTTELWRAGALADVPGVKAERIRAPKATTRVFFRSDQQANALIERPDRPKDVSMSPPRRMRGSGGQWPVVVDVALSAADVHRLNRWLNDIEGISTSGVMLAMEKTDRAAG